MPQTATHSDYNHDVILWAQEQAALLRAGRFAELDIANIAEEIEDVGKSEQRELASRMAVLLMHLLKWRYQPGLRCVNRRQIVRLLRKRVHYSLRRAPSLHACLADPEWLEDVWSDALLQANEAFYLPDFPEQCPWPMTDALTEGWLPDDAGSEE